MNTSNGKSNKIVIKLLIIPLLISAHIIFTYNYFYGWWNSLIGTALIVGFCFLIFEKPFLAKIGLSLKSSQLIKSIVAAAIFTMLSVLVMNYIGRNEEVQISFTNFGNYFHDVFYVLNEELILGSLILFTLVRKWKLKPLIVSIGLAVVFALMHYVFYRWVFNDKGLLSVTTLLSLTFVGVIRNNLILTTGNIGYSWALHFGWTAVMFGSKHYLPIADRYLGEFECFSLYLGSIEMFVIAFVLALVSCFVLIKKKKTQYHSG